ncbi:MAG: glutamate--tRNA ligase [Eubacteriales bacterium]|nr:glutamate--tRNA ligase [Eubacteriales bacterium]
MRIRTRYAPSPTGRMHVGNLRTALYAYLIAKHADGDFLLRIEDTDRERYVEGAVDIIYKTLRAAGMDHDEGPDKPGDCGPYVQSERQASGLYLKYAEALVEKGAAYYCFCDKERLDGLKTTTGEEGVTVAAYDKHCLKLSADEVAKKLADGVPYVIRQNNPTEGKTTFQDEIYGEISVDNAELDDMILIKSDGYPTYNFANVVDDHLMGITHIVRGNEYLSSSPKYNRLYEAFGWPVPTYVHCPLITDENHKKLSKRSGHASFEDLLEQGFLPATIVNYVALLGWSPPGNEEIISMDEMIRAFDYRSITKSPSVFDMNKLRWMNGEYIKAMDADTFYEAALPYLQAAVHADVDLRRIAELIRTRIEVFPEIGEMVDFFDALPDYDIAMYTHKRMKTNPENSLPVLEEELARLEQTDDFTEKNLHTILMAYVAEKGIKNGMALWPLRTAVSGKQSTPGGAFEIMAILGKEESLRRIRVGIEKLREANHV